MLELGLLSQVYTSDADRKHRTTMTSNLVDFDVSIDAVEKKTSFLLSSLLPYTQEAPKEEKAISGSREEAINIYNELVAQGEFTSDE